jgi:hypothetical protein
MAENERVPQGLTPRLFREWETVYVAEESRPTAKAIGPNTGRRSGTANR